MGDFSRGGKVLWSFVKNISPSGDECQLAEDKVNKTPPTILFRERQPHLATLSLGAGKTVEPFY
jgi:hypothetical protein